MNNNSICPPGQICFQYSKAVLFILILALIFYFFYDKIKYNHLFKQQYLIQTKQNYLSNKMNNITHEIDNSSNDIISNEEKITNEDIGNSENIVNNENITNENISNSIHNYHDKMNKIKHKQKNVIHQQNNYHVDTEPMYLVNKSYERVINPLLPPERSNPYDSPYLYYKRGLGVPINIPTRGYEGDYQQVGILVNNNNDKVYPLYGKPTFPSSSKWLYYTATDKFRSVKLPISKNNRNCTENYGCDEIYQDDELEIPAFNEKFKVSLYSLDKPKYIPFL